MPLLPETAAAITNTIDNISNVVSASGANRNQRKWMEHQYEKQRQHALADWSMQNEYNSPQSQMQRLREAGLNPNLVYGHGADAQMGAPMRASTPGTWNPKPPEFAVGSMSKGYFDTQIQQATLDNLKRQNTLIETERLLKLAQTDATATGANQAKFNLAIDQELKQWTIAGRQADVTAKEATSALKRNELEIAWATKDYNIQQAAINVLTSRLRNAQTEEATKEIQQRIKNLQQDEKIKTITAQWMKLGLTPNDPAWQRKLVQLVQGITE